jgi:hypothetical protein
LTVRRRLAVLALFTFALALRLIFFGGLLGWDDVDFIRAAEALVAGETMPRTSADLRYGFVVPLAITSALVGPGELSAVLVPLTYWILEFVVVFALGHLLGGFRLGMMAAAIVALAPLDVLAATELHSDLAAGVWMAATMYGVMRGERAAASGVAWFAAAGICLGVASLTKEIAPALLLVLAGRELFRRVARARPGHATRWPSYVAFGVGLAAVRIADAAWLAWQIGSPAYRHSREVFEMHASLMRLLAPSYGWMLSFPSMLLNPLSAHFGYFAGLGWLGLVAAVWAWRRRDAIVLELTLWWGLLLLVFNFAPLDLGFTRPLFHHAPRILYPLIVPLALAGGAWFLSAAGRRWRIALAAAFIVLSGAGTWATHADYRQWAWVARRVAAVVDAEPVGTLVVSDVVSRGLLGVLVPHRRADLRLYQETDLRRLPCGALVLRDPLALTGARMRGQPIPAPVGDPPAEWKTLATFERPPRPSLRGALLGRITGERVPRRDHWPSDSAVLWTRACEGSRS